MNDKISTLLLLLLVTFAQSWNIAEHLSTKTPYTPRNASNIPTPPGCQAVHYQIVSRHGARYPTLQNIMGYEKLFKKIQDNKNYIQIEWLKNWTNSYSPDHEGALAVQGQEELYQLGQRANDNYQEIFTDGKYNPVVYPIQTTYIPRASVSGNVFGYAIFGQEGKIGPVNYQPIYSFTESKGLDYTLRFFESCTNYVKNVDKHGTEKKKYAEKFFPAIADKINTMIGAAPHFFVTSKNLTVFYDLCSLDYVLHDKDTTKFCSLFSQQDIETIETYYDIGSYYDKGYGWDLSYKIACPLVNDVLDKMDKVVNGSDKTTRAYMRFAHAETILPFVAILGLYKDNFQLKADTDPELLATRLWRTSKISTFSANLQFILYNCTDGLRVEVQHNEEQIKLDGCDDVFCPFDKFRKTMQNFAKGNFFQMCGIVFCSTQEVKFDPISVYIVLIFLVCLIAVITGIVVYFKFLRDDNYKEY